MYRTVARQILLLNLLPRNELNFCWRLYTYTTHLYRRFSSLGLNGEVYIQDNQLHELAEGVFRPLIDQGENSIRLFAAREFVYLFPFCTHLE